MYNLGKNCGERYKNNFSTAGMTQDSIITKWKESGTTQHLTKAGVLTTLRNLQRRSKDKLWPGNSLTDRSGRTTYCSFMQWDIFLEGQQSVEFFTNLGQMAMRPERSYSWKNAYEGSTINENERNRNLEAKDCKIEIENLCVWGKPDTSHHSSFFYENWRQI